MNPKTPEPKASKASVPQPGKKPQSKEEAIRKMVESDPEKAAEILREILRNR